MKYIIEKSSNWRPETPPVEGAIQEEIHRILKIRKGYEHKWSNKYQWKESDEEGILECVNDETETVWVAEVEDLHKFVLEVGHRIILDKPTCVEGYWQIEIYDYYRE
jgi:hypothetical protein